MAEPVMRRVLLVEDDLRVRGAVRALLGEAADRYALVAEAGTVAAGRAALGARRPDLLLLDLQLPDGSGLELLRDEHTAACLTMIMTVFDDDAHVFDSLRAGAVGYLLKDDVFEHLLPSLDEVCAGGSPMSSSVARRVLMSFRSPPRATSSDVPLTPREIEVLTLLARGCTYDEVARLLAISTNTVRTYIRSIYEQLHVSTKTEAALEAIRRGLIPPGS
jgi:DNA-binding NarL/FixJ family response regulator